MTKTRWTCGTALTGAALFLAACGNGNNDAALLVKQLPAALTKQETQAVTVTPEQIAQALSATDAPVNMYVMEDREVQFLMFDIQRNGPYQSFGSSSRQVIAMHTGMITSTRGFGGDLISSDVNGLLSATLSGGGSAQYTMRFLTSENITVSHTYTCQVVSSGALSPDIAATYGQATLVNAKCEGDDDVSFTNTFAVAPDGYIISTRQWLGDVLGYVAAQSIRR